MEKKEEPIINPNSEILTWEKQTLPMEESVFKMMFEAHGSNQLINNTYSFDFRGKKYQISNKQNEYEYQVHIKTDTSNYVDYLKNGDFSRMVEGEEVELSPKEITRYSNALNSVIYFSTLPYKLKDEAVNKNFKGTGVVMGNKYFLLEVTFNEEGGGVDHDDEYMYWINTETHEIDYLAYTYKVNNGGVRFRIAYNKQKVNDVLFQDYINYKAEIGTPLENLPQLYEKGELEELSKIETENITLI